MKTTLLICAIAISVVLTGCAGGHGDIDLHKTLALIMILVIIALFFILAIYSNMLRDQVNCDVLNAEVDQLKLKGRVKFYKNNAPFSLSRVQLAAWTVIIASSYIYLQFCKGPCNITEVNQTALILMGIGAGVTVVGAAIDNREIQNNAPRHQNFPSDGFLLDILSDNQGISIHRFQNVVWTVIAMIVYLNKVYIIKTECALPELSGTLLALTGISSATYLALKTQENSISGSVAPINLVNTPTIVQVPAQPQANMAVVNNMIVPAEQPATPPPLAPPTSPAANQ